MGLFGGLGTAVGSFFGGPLGGAAGGVIGGLIDANQGEKSQEATNQRNLDIQHDYMNWQERMSNTQFQRRTKDLEAAGLNPMLAVQQGGAAMPSASQASAVNPLSTGVSTAQQGAQTNAAILQAASSQAQIDLTRAQADKLRSETMDKSVNTARVIADLGTAQGVEKGTWYDAWRKESEYTAMNRGDAAGFRADVERKKAAATTAQYGTAAAKAEADFYKSDFGIANPYLMQILNVLRGVTSAAHSLR